MNLLESLRWSDQKLTESGVPHALIGGLALAHYGYGRGTQDIDWLVPEESKDSVKRLFHAHGFKILHESDDVLQFEGLAPVDFLIARRPISRQMIEDSFFSSALQLKVVRAEDLIGLKIQAYSNDPKRKNKDLADIQELISLREDLDWEKIKTYADLFDAWAEISILRSGS
ncbi:MAG: hypothetical protein EBX52_04715 [Proteobacteria bacterium]|nr:hypothetical protein [Pseudomonadota bacterium]